MTTKVNTNEFKWFQNINYEHLLAGVSGGLTSTLILHPLDLIKIRFAITDGKFVSVPQYNSIFNAFTTILRTEGLRGLYSGVVPNLWGSGSSWGLYFLFYNSLKTYVQKGDTNIALSPTMHLTLASVAGATTLLMTNPIWVLKTRMCLQYGSKPIYNGMADALIKVYKQEGIAGYYRGLVPGLFGVSHGAVHFMVYDELKNRYNKYKNRPISTKLTNTEYLIFAGISKIIAASCTYPYQVIRARLLNQHYSYDGSIDCIQKTWKYEGWRGFYKGLGTSLLRVTPATMITFVTYENVFRFLMNHKY